MKVNQFVKFRQALEKDIDAVSRISINRNPISSIEPDSGLVICSAYMNVTSKSNHFIVYQISLVFTFTWSD